MTHPLIKYNDMIVMPPAYFGSVRYYALMASHRAVAVNCLLPYDKRKKFVHRCEIVDTRHRIYLTVPVDKRRLGDGAGPGGKPLWGHYTVSSHNQWWNLHRVALESAYGRTPFFEFYAPEIMPLLTQQTVGAGIVDLAVKTDAVVRKLLHLPCEVSYVDCDEAVPADARYVMPPYPVVDTPYYQLRASELGFQPGLSILDLIFNCGPEAQLVLSEMAACL